MKYIVNVTVTMTRQTMVYCNDPDVAESIAAERAITDIVFCPGEYPDDTIVTSIEEENNDI